MTLYRITARRHTDRPDADGRSSSGRDVPPFHLDGPSAPAVLEHAHRILGEGVGGITSTVALVADPADVEFCLASSVQYWLNGTAVEPTEYVWQHATEGRVLQGGLYDREDADEATAFTAGSEVLVSVNRTSRGKWRIVASDHAHFALSDYRRRFTSPAEALAFTEQRMRRLRPTVLVEVDEF